MVARRPNTVTATFSPSGSIQGVLAQRDIESGLDFSGVAPVFYCPTSDATLMVEDLIITIDGDDYTIKQIHKKSSGISAMLLENA
jgi:hypothetical protein